MRLSGKQIHVVFTASSLLNKQLRPNEACDEDIGVRGRLNQYPGCLPFERKFRKFRMEGKRYGRFSEIPTKN